MSKIILISSVDYELFGDGTGNVTREQIETTDSIIKIANKFGVKLTIMFEYAQYCAYEKYGNKENKFLEDNEKIRNQLIYLVKNGHDVQLHYHAQWNNAIYLEETNKFNLNFKHVDISTLEYDEIVRVLKDGKGFLESLLKPYKKSYECIAFRAGSWAVKDEKKLIKAMRESKLCADSSVVPNVKFESEQVNFEYKNCPHNYHYWYVDELLSKAGEKRNFVEIPIFTIKHPFAFIKYINHKYLTSRKIVNTLYKTKISEKNFSLIQKVHKIITRDYYMADLNNMSYKTLIDMIELVIHDSTYNNKAIIPLMMISHSKTSYAIDDLNLFYDYINTHYKEKVEYWTFQEIVSYLLRDNSNYLKS